MTYDFDEVIGGAFAVERTDRIKTLTAAADVQTGAMVALVPSDDDLKRLPLDVDGAEPAEELHLTLCYLGEAASYPPELQAQVIAGVSAAVARYGQVVEALVFGADLWNPTNPDPAWVLAVGDDPDAEGCGLEGLRDCVYQALELCCGSLIPEQHTPWVPHVCLAYSDDLGLLEQMLQRVGPVTFTAVRVAFAGQVTDITLPVRSPAATGDASGTMMMTGDTSTLVGDPMPWHKTRNHSGCPTSKPWAVVKDSDGHVEGCHATEREADNHLAALYANESTAAEEATVTDVLDDDLQVVDDDLDDEELGGKPNPGTPADQRLKKNKGKKMAPAYAEGDAAPGGSTVTLEPTWRGVLAVEGEPTGDGREFAPNALTWPDPTTTVIPLRWNIEDSHGGEKRTTAVAVGRITNIWRDGSKVMGSGVFNMDDPNGQQAYTNVQNGFLAGVSIDADDIAEADVEYVWPEKTEGSEVEEDGDIISILFGTPDKVIFHNGRIRAATLCDIPAFVDAAIELVQPGAEDDALAASVEAITFDAVGPHKTATSDSSWSGPSAERNLPSPMPVATARQAYAWIDTSMVEDGMCPKSAGKFIHHEVSADGSVGAANLTACSTGIGVLHGGRGGTNASDPQGIYNHLAKHLRDGGQEPPPFDSDAAVALLASAAAQWRPDPEWFQNPGFNVASPIIVTDDGRVYGHAAEWGQCHIGYPSECVTPPREADHPYFMTGFVVASNGQRIPVGQITADIGHAPLSWGAQRAMGHYDNTEFVVADVTVGNDRHGIWVAGAIRPWATDKQVHVLRASGQVSPDWRSIGGQLRMVGMLTVNTSGYQARRSARAAVTADGSIKSLVSSGFTTVQLQPHMNEEDLDRRALELMREGLRARVARHRGGR
jgi:hypothetical protein